MAREGTAAFDNDLAEFLAPYVRTNEPRYRSARWLKSEYDSPIWEIESATAFSIDWRIMLDDGQLLTSPHHSSLWETLRSWLVVQTHVDATGREIAAPRTERNALQFATYCIDYLLLRSSSLGLSRHGLSALTQNDFVSMISTISSNRSALVTVYDWPNQLGQFLRSKIAALSPEQRVAAIIAAPEIAGPIVDETDRLTDLSEEEIIAARAWLHDQNLYKPGTNTYRLQPNVFAIAGSIYASTIGRLSVNFSLPEELCVGPGHRFVTEYQRARVTSARDERITAGALRKYVRTVGNLRLLNSEGLQAPALDPDNLERSIAAVDVKPLGRFRTLPHEVVFGSLKKAIEFALEFGDALVDSYVAACRAATSAGQSVATYFNDNDLLPHLTPDVVRLGTRRWSIDPIGGSAPYSPDPSDYHRQLRDNVGLYQCLRVLYGAIEIVAGTLMARRQGELIDLLACRCLDSTRTRLVFRNRKSSFGGMRELESRPIPPIAARLIGILERLQMELLELGAITATTNLFSTPRRIGGISTQSCLTNLSKTSFSESIDFFCDWSQVPLDKEGKRFYIRQHQLRRFFAMLFFYGGGFGGMETLRWFMGHTDAQHLWHYITESTPGETIRSVAAEWAAYGVRHGTREAELLGAELAIHFGTSDFSVLEDEALVLYLEDLMEEGKLRIEPEFLDGGRNYRIAVVVRGETTVS